MNGITYIVGAGPGRADLITVRGLRLLQQAEVVLYDHLVARDLLDEAPQAEWIFVGKQPGCVAMPQTMINQTLVERTRAGQRVVRLKGGDPFVFGRGGEEALALRQAGLPFEIVPGVSLAIAAPAYAGIPLTQRGISTAFAVVTGHEAPGKPGNSTDWHALARIPTLVILMGVNNIAAICAALIHAGQDGQTPAAVVSEGTTGQQRAVQATVATLPAVIASHRITHPAVIVIGAVAALGPALAWFTPDPSAPGFVGFEE
ncbi:MAG: uroporphyrinogen-III C-methyltransferase [Chloroflexi bacterium]|nr:uroporphyrinogen-III C-methyltransferase [Chloroflexota bacterium]